jgi:hypothetical protein
LNRRLGGPKSRSGRGGEEKNSQPLPGLEPSIIQPVAQRYTTELSQLLEKKAEEEIEWEEEGQGEDSERETKELINVESPIIFPPQATCFFSHGLVCGDVTLCG